MGTPLPRPAVDSLASWPTALSTSPLSTPSLRGVSMGVPLLSQLPPFAPHPSDAGGAPRGEDGRHHKSAEGVWEARGSRECGIQAPPPPAQPPVTPPPPPTEWFAPSALFNPGDCSSAGSLPVPASAPGLEAAPGAPLWTATPATQNPGPSPWRSRLASAQPGRWPGSAMGAPSALPLLLLLACSWAPGGANLSQDGE